MGADFVCWEQAKHNNLMSNSDKDFITRIQVSQLVTDDPYADDFYFHIMAAIKMSRSVNANGGGAGPMMQGGGGGGGGGGGRRGERKPTRRENAMNKMAQNVQRLVDVAKQRNKSGQRTFRSSSLAIPADLPRRSQSLSTAPSARSLSALVRHPASSSKSLPLLPLLPPPCPAQDTLSSLASSHPPPTIAITSWRAQERTWTSTVTVHRCHTAPS